MCKSDLLNKVVRIVAEETEISPANIMGGGKSADVVDARYLAVYFLIKRGFYPRTIAQHLNITPQAVNCIFRRFDDRRKQSGIIFEINFQHIKMSLENN